MIVSPASGNRGVTETMSTFREPRTRIRGGMVGGVLLFVGREVVVGRIEDIYRERGENSSAVVCLKKSMSS